MPGRLHALRAAGQVKLAAQFAAIGAQLERRAGGYQLGILTRGIACFAIADAGARFHERAAEIT